ncbi:MULTISPECIES: YjcZ family sporulation protein [Bacillaceae]|uniref:YjcZ family sporulation protein n=1 Tax=Evansella alkalicola TaxID=745819 RepID=A0ABS6JTI0_9BACI|nr:MULTISPECIES: YjcZ family sporulation protein [Bacillaceae]MBU9721880.1 YjcZ family sporulation protein [Bacillus alkalicola]
MSHTARGVGSFAFILVVFILLVIIGAAVVRPGYGYGY